MYIFGWTLFGAHKSSRIDKRRKYANRTAMQGLPARPQYPDVELAAGRARQPHLAAVLCCSFTAAAPRIWESVVSRHPGPRCLLTMR